VASLAPPGGGTALIQMLQMFDELGLQHFDPDSPEAALTFASMIAKARQDRRRYRLGENTRRPEGFPDLASRDYAASAAAGIRQQFPAGGETSHLVVADRSGNVVSMTQSIERSFGACVATPGLGFLYNGCLRAFKVKNTRHPHFLAPGGVARSNAAPTIVFDGGLPLVVVGSTGSERTASGIFQVLVRLRTQAPFDAVQAPRLHCTPEGEVWMESEGFHPDVVPLLESHGLRIMPLARWSYKAGGLQLLARDGEDWTGVADPRRDGAAAGA